MIEKELKKQSRAELLELLLLQTKESERLKAQLEKAQQQLADRRLQVQDAGNLANAVIAVNGVMEAAQAAAQQYLENIARMEEEARLRCDKLLEEAQKEADGIRAEAEKIRSEARRLQTELEHSLSEAEQNRRKAAAVSKREMNLPTTDDALMEEVYQLLRE